MPEQGDEIPASTLDEVERLTRLARNATDPNEASAYRDQRATLLSSYDFMARVRTDETRDVLVVHPAEWVDDGQIDVEAIDDVDRASERPLSGPDSAADWETVEAHNRAVAETVATRYGEPHGATAHALADFAGNHYKKPIEELTAAEREEFSSEYFVRNAWPSDAQLANLDASFELISAVATESGTVEK